AAPAVRARVVGADAVDDRVARQKVRERRELVGIVVAFEQRRGKVVRQLLKAQDVEVRELAGMRDHARGVDAAVEAAEPLHVPGNQIHLIPSRMNDATNWRWNSRKPISSGAV